ncbi:iron-sulfur cluster assembly scaffold protein [Leptospira bourretii]|uniref:Iron-sulfur cluster assembly scaffold protein n=1 Tax=Leptospira bourretii TaxID=2484962 RepID=A0A4R9IKK4_9LEPT|nr:iron-sulfur cluster assembly scaffold protein [Leptospira bourretii]TGK79747.1 iron-sulfur cluster assembly scaffold protein [Leptospira bourretii]TGK89955.1 iron-sulfur cluster assembly scaffold protein [Leptospira bourretii]TGL19824.1 iron-sulfur cluster assembly scaffold protein [Leptospira bourretii]TGL36046.1 iron-sulfur cluster assembly scaffold protein [Leptospira bourretii]
MSQESKFEDFLRWKSFGLWEKPSVPYQTLKGLNPLCGDEIYIYYQEKEDHNFQILGLGGESCSICSAAAGLLFRKKEGLTPDQFQSYLLDRKNFLDGEDSCLIGDEEEISFWKVLRNHPGRYRCGLLPWQTLVKFREGNL